MSKAFVTGGSGFIGRALIRRLISDGVQVTALVRSTASARVVETLGATAVLGDLPGTTSWEGALRNHDVVFHLAAEKM